MGQQESFELVSIHTNILTIFYGLFLFKIWSYIYIFSFNEKRCFELIEYLIEVPPADCTHDRGHKFPFLANQVFIDGGDGVIPIVEQFFYSKAAPRVDEKKNDKWEIE